jgi:hypothetical protein
MGEVKIRVFLFHASSLSGRPGPFGLVKHFLKHSKEKKK